MINNPPSLPLCVRGFDALALVRHILCNSSLCTQSPSSPTTWFLVTWPSSIAILKLLSLRPLNLMTFPPTPFPLTILGHSFWKVFHTLASVLYLHWFFSHLSEGCFLSLCGLSLGKFFPWPCPSLMISAILIDAAVHLYL